MIRLNVRSIAHFLSLLLVILLLWSSKGFLIANPLVSAPILLLFSILYLVIGLTLDSSFFIYPSVALFTLAYYLGAYHLHPYPIHAPLLSVILVGIFLWAAFKYQTKKILSAPFRHGAYGLIVFFTMYLLSKANHYVQADQLVPMITFGSYAVGIGIQSLIDKRGRFRYWSLLNASLAFLFALYSINRIPLGHYSIYLMAFFVSMMHIGTLIHRRAGFGDARPFYWVGFFGLAFGPLYSVHNPEILLALQAFYALHFWEIRYEIKTIEQATVARDTTCRIFTIMVYPLTLVCLALIIQQHFPITFTVVGTCLIFAFLYFKIAHDHRDSWRGRDLFFVITGTMFLTIAYLTGLFLLMDPTIHPWALLLCIPLAWLLLAMGHIYIQMERHQLGRAFHWVHYAVMAVCLAMPLFFITQNITVLLVLDSAFLLTCLAMYLMKHWWGFLYALPLTLTYLYYLALQEAFVPAHFISPAFIIPGIIIVSFAIWLAKKSSRWQGIFFLWFYTLSFCALVTLDCFHVTMGYSLALWGILYLLVGTFARLPSEHHASYFTTAGHTLTLAAALAILLFFAPQATLHVFLIIGVPYLMIYLYTRRERLLYPVAVAGTVSYFLAFLHGLPWDLACLGSVPLVALIYGIWVAMDMRYQKGAGLPLKRVGHATAIVVTLMLMSNLSTARAGVAITAFTLYAVIYCLLAMLYRTYDLIFLGIGFGSLIYFEILGIPSTIQPERHLQLFSLIMIPLSAIGYWCWRRKKETWSLPLLDAAVIVSLITTLLSLSQGFVWTTQVILIVSAVLFMLLSLVLKKDLYIFLTTLCLGLSAYNSVVATKNKFVIDLVVYSIYALIFIGIFFFLPVFKRILNFRGPRYMFRAINWKAVLFYGSFGAIIVIVFAFLYSLQLANFPGFCTKCHFMEPYAEAWEHSSHKNVNCVDCHYEPGLRPVVQGKINGLVSVVKYVTKTYAIKPNSEISDVSCLRSGCHDRMELHSEITFKNDIKFNHYHHLKNLRRGKLLRCTTCHSQIVQGEHITVTESICFTCHFKGRNRQGVGIGRCMICHDNPSEPVLYHGVEFDHRSFLEGKPDSICIDCHAGVTQGEGEVPMERCFSCHMEQNPDLSDPEFLHLEHITNRKVECFECHLDIKHGMKAMSQQIKWDCNECHKSSHTIAEKMYLGIGGIGITGDPDPMFSAKVSCQGCHKYTQTITIGGVSFETTKADIKACDDCHGEGLGYTELAEEWQAEIRQNLEGVMALRKRLENPIQQLEEKAPSSHNTAILPLYRKAEANLLFVQTDGSRGVHNYLYTLDLLSSIEKDFKQCLSLLEKAGSLRDN